MNAEVIAIGDELTSGQRLDTNSQWLSHQLGDLGIRVLFHTTVGDDLAACREVFRQALQRADVIVVTGGLGPTADDLTRQALAAAIGQPLELRKAVLEHVAALFASRGRAMPEQNRIQAMFPRGAEVIPNPHGTAPGIECQVDRNAQTPAHLFALPGVPAEMREMWHETVLPRLMTRLGDQRKLIRHRCIKCFGVGESDLEQMLPDLIRRGRMPSVGITVSRATITLRVTAVGASEADCDSLMEPTIATIRECLGELIFGEGDEELQHAVVRLLQQRRKTLATAEWGPGGLLALWLSEADEDGTCFLGGRVFPSPQPPHGSLQEQVAQAARDVRIDLAADYGLAIGPFPALDADANPGASRVALAVSTAAGTEARSIRFAGHPDILKARTTKQALNLMRQTICATAEQP